MPPAHPRQSSIHAAPEASPSHTPSALHVRADARQASPGLVLQQYAALDRMVGGSRTLTDQRRMIEQIHSSPRQLKGWATAQHGAAMSTSVAQLAAPVPVSAEKTGFQDRYRDPTSEVEFIKLSDKRFLLNGQIIEWKDPDYVRRDGAKADLRALSETPEQDADVLDISQGESAYLPSDASAIKKIRTTNASPCVILSIHDTKTRATMMAHIHRKNRVAVLIEDAVQKFTEENVNLSVSIVTLAYSDDDPERQKEERAVQDELIKTIKSSVASELCIGESEIAIVADQENAMINAEDGSLTHPENASVSASRGQLGAWRAMTTEEGWDGAAAVDGTKGFKTRTANVMPEDAAALQRATSSTASASSFSSSTTAQRKVIVNGEERAVAPLVENDEWMRKKVSDSVERTFLDEEELEDYKANRSRHIGTLRDAPVGNEVWVRFNPSKKYVMGESHTKLVLSHVTKAVKTTNFQHERFSKLGTIRQQGYTHLAEGTEAMNKPRYELYGVDMARDQQIDRYALESPMPKIAFCLEGIEEELTSPDAEKGSYFKGVYPQYLQLSFSLVKDLSILLSDQRLIDRSPLKTVLSYIKSSELDFEEVQRFAQYLIQSPVDKKPGQRSLDNFLLYCRMFIFDTLREGNKSADRTRDPTSELVKRKRRDGDDLTNPILPGEESTKDALSYIRDEEMMNHIRSDVQFVGMGDAHARRLAPRLISRGFTVIHVPKEDFNGTTKTF
ncbi:hypothetical protein [Roseateles amylovorans]|uniref:Uncharacterized protein n=1 Tax=Roseateles amylovorans TaxID=2978473 RepID=A0ABY6ASR1_9BURK|nr:hypothetical protein [Roseateles amylovorans]UXH76047.1 hypothetical protein N4261_13270 [Roseateles amylovorans]